MGNKIMKDEMRTTGIIFNGFIRYDAWVGGWKAFSTI
jgi:hypothetical protein